jgi:diketogulonate reductase-like aldo/keto reductase
MITETYTLNNGVKIPKIGLGTWFINNSDVAEVMNNAMEVGYRHFDTAQAYRNEAGVGEGVRSSVVKRKDLFITSKLHPVKELYDDPEKAIQTVLETLNIEYLDLLLIHSPQPWTKYHGKKKYYQENKKVWKAMEKAYKEGKLKAIGVSNFLQDDLENLLEDCEIKPMVNQMLLHIGNTPFELLKYCQKNEILVVAHSPIAHGKALKNKNIQKIALKYNVSIPQLCIRYVLELGALPIPKTSNVEHMKSNIDVTFEISKEDIETLKKIKPIRYGLLKMFPVYSGK